MGREILQSDLGIDIDLGDPTTRRLFARRLASEIEDSPWKKNPHEANPNEPRLTRDRAIEVMQDLLSDMHRADESGSTHYLRGIINRQDKFEAVAGQPIDAALDEAMTEFEEYDIRSIGQWFID